jgi:hypothetical protein
MKRGMGSKPLLEFDIKSAQSIAKSESHVARLLGVSLQTYRKYSKMYGLYGKCKNPHGKGIPKPYSPHKGIRTINDILAGKYPEYPPMKIKEKLIKAGIKEEKCEMCGYNEARITDGKIPLLLNFNDGNKHNHKIENLQLLCFNCTYTCGRGSLVGKEKTYIASEVGL